jgi:hypothetical protein
MNYPASSQTLFKLGIFCSKISYSIIATSIFYYLPQYFPVYRPKQERKRRILNQVYQKTIIIDTLIENLKFNLVISHIDVADSAVLKDILRRINPDKSIATFPSLHKYLFYFKTQLLEVIRSMTFYHDYLSDEFLREIMLIERQVFSDKIFSGEKTLACSDFTYAEIELQEILIHNKHLQDLRQTELKNYERQFEIDGKIYRDKHYKAYDQEKGGH